MATQNPPLPMSRLSHRTRIGLASAAAASLLALAGCSGGDEPSAQPSPSNPAPVVSQSAAPSASVTPSETASDGTPGDSQGQRDAFEAETQRALEEAQPTAEAAAAAYNTLSSDDASWRVWLKRLEAFSTDGFIHSMAETFGDDQRWKSLVVDQGATITGTVTSVAPDDASTPNQPVFLIDVSIERQFEASSAQDAAGTTSQTFVVTLERAAGSNGDWVVSDITTPEGN